MYIPPHELRRKKYKERERVGHIAEVHLLIHQKVEEHEKVLRERDIREDL